MNKLIVTSVDCPVQLINHVDKVTGHLELKINYEGEKATAEAH